jgi:hypothetical protein
MRFSERMGLRQVRTAIQVDSMDDALRAGLWNVFEPNFIAPLNNRWPETVDRTEAILRYLWDDFFKRPSDEAPQARSAAIKFFKPFFLEEDYILVYDLIDFTVQSLGTLMGSALEDGYNRILEREVSGYRFIAGILSPISNDFELQAIEDGVGLTGPFSGAAAHLQSALRMLSDREDPDYRNAIKESISAVESAARVVTGHKKPMLSQLLSILEKSGHIHPAQKDAFTKLYGYTSDEGGIRHAMLEEPDISFADAKYMLVVCAAFVAYLQAAV